MAGNPARQVRRRAWLVARPDLLARLPSDREDVTDAHRAALDEAFAGLRASGLYGREYKAQDAHWNIRGLVTDIRGGPGRNWNAWLSTTETM